jgi:GWxTD domain-containing protein
MARAFAVTVFCFAFFPRAAHAQRPLGADTLSAKAVAESLIVLAQVRKELDKDRNNAPLWYHRGMLAWALYDRDRTNGGLKELDYTFLGREADSSIRIAASAAPDSARYKLTLAQFYLGTGWMPVRVQAYRAFDGALKAARRTGDSLLLAEALVEKGRVHWRRYDPSSFGFVPSDVRQQAYLLENDSTKAEAIAHDIDTTSSEVPLTREALRVARAQLQEEFRGDGGFSGEADYKRAEDYFREAVAVAPGYERGYRQTAMLLAERERWGELLALARTRLAQNPDDAWAHMTSALAAYRSGNRKYAETAFDKGFRLLSPAERGRLDNIERMVRPSDSATFAGWPDSTRKAYEAKYWSWSAPLWSREHTSPRIEFLARVTYAELRWTVDELRRRGADSDRGRIYIRYGPPDARATTDNSMPVVGANVDRGGPERDDLGGNIETWWYDFARLAFHFRGMPTFGTSYFTNPAAALERMDSIPGRWDNIARERVDSLPVRVARFRAQGDSVDVIFASQPPVKAIREAASVEGNVRTDFWLLDTNLRPWAHDSGTTSVGGARAFVRRLATGDYMYRFEATAESSLLGARALASMRIDNDDATDFALSGFGMSDVLLATRVAPRGQGRRWSDFDYDASAGSVASGSEIAMLWELYDFGEKDGAANYDITFSIERKYKKFLDRVRAKVVSSFSSMIGNEQTEDRVIYRYTRTTGHAPVIADYITLVLTDLPGGEYDLTVEILDKNSGRTTSKTSRIVIRE